MDINNLKENNTPESLSDLPESLKNMVNVIGLAPTMAIVNAFGGTILFIPKKTNDRHRLINLIGIDQFKLIVSSFGGNSFAVPRMANVIRSNRNREIVQRYDSGDSVYTLASAYKMTNRQIYNILSKTT